MKTKFTACCAVLALVASGELLAQTLYKLTDKNGKVTYSEAPPKNYDGKVERIVIDPNANTATLPKLPPPPPMDASPTPSSDSARPAKSKAVTLDEKRAALEAAKKAYKDAVDNPRDGEITRVGNVNGMTRPVPSDEYTRRLAGLEAAVKAAEEDLRRAEGGWFLAAATALLLGLPVAAQVLYKWTDAQGRVQYSDQKPKNFAGEVTRLEQDAKPDTPAPIAPAVPGKASTPSEREAEGAPAKDLATQRRTTREALALRLEKARANLVTARKALEDGINPAPDEQQVVRQIQQAGQGGMHGQTQSRSNCSQVIRNGKVVGVMCPSLAPKEEYFERQSRLEAAVKAAEEEVDAAELAYRRGVD